MAKGLFDVQCPCCQATLKIDPVTEAVIAHEEAVKPKLIEDLGAAVQKLKGEGARREELFQKSVANEKKQQQVLSTKFDELLRQAKEKPDTKPRVRDFDLD